MLEHAAFAPCDLPGLPDQDAAVELVKKLVQLGFLSIADPKSLSAPQAAAPSQVGSNDSTATLEGNHGHGHH